MERNTHLVGQSSSFLDAVERASRAAPLDRPVLVIGERGTGKELIAERLHHLSSRCDAPLIVLNCAALPETLIEAELFGHEAGALTGATQARPGRAPRGGAPPPTVAPPLRGPEPVGREAGAFAGATKARPGRFEEADGGTLFLD